MRGMPLGRRLMAAWHALRADPVDVVPSDTSGERRLSAILASAPTVVYTIAPAHPNAFSFVTTNIREVVGHAAAMFQADSALWSHLVHPDDRANRELALTIALADGKSSVEYRYHHGDGSWRWIRDQMRSLCDENGRAREIVGSLVDVTDRRLSENALAASEVQLRTTQRLLSDALESSEDAFTLFDANDELVLYNKRYRVFYPTIADQIRPGVRFEDLLRASAQRGQYADVLPDQVEEWVKERLDRHNRACGVFEQRMSDGRCLEIVERSTAEGGRVAIRRDVTARKQIEEALRQELSFEQTMLDALPFPVFFKGRNGRFLGCNAKMCEATGHAMTEIVGRNLLEMLPPEKADEYVRIDQEIFGHPGAQSHELTVQWADGSFRRINLVSGTFNDKDGQVAGYIGSLIDITPQKRAEEQLVQAAKLATLGQIASEVAHELNQPLSIIRMSAENLLIPVTEDSSVPGRPKLESIVSQVTRMAEMVDHLRRFSRVEGGEKKPFSLPQVARSAATLLVPHMQLDGITLDMEFADDLPELSGYPNQLEQVVLNLLANARDAVRALHPNGGGMIGLTVTRHDDGARLIVRDNGGGIPPNHVGTIFEPFFTTKAEGAGTGLGLSISANIVSAMGGRISVTNENDGAVFTVTLPLPDEQRARSPVAETSAPPAQNPTLSAEVAAQKGARGRVLVVDDEALALECIADFLEARNFRAITASKPAQAIDMASSGDIDLVITDMRMPGMGGLELVERLRSGYLRLPAIMMTGGPIPDVAALSDIRVLRKPLALNELLVQIQDLLVERRSECSG